MNVESRDGSVIVARGLTRRLERLKTGVETLGAGDLAARVRVEGKDEVAHLAESFNHAAARIEELDRRIRGQGTVSFPWNDLRAGGLQPL